MVQTLNESNFDNEIADKVILVDFFATWCGPCHRMAPILTELANDFSVAKVNTDENFELASKYNVSAVPTFIVFKNGVEVKRLIGSQKKDDLADAIRAVSLDGGKME